MANALDHLASGRTRTEWLSQLNTEYRPAKNYRRTAIIGTIGRCSLLLTPPMRFSMLTLLETRPQDQLRREDQPPPQVCVGSYPAGLRCSADSSQPA